MATMSRTAGRRFSLSWNWGARAIAWPAAALFVIAHLVFGDPGFSQTALFYSGLVGAIALIGVFYATPFVLPLLPILLIRFYFAMGYPVFAPPRMITAAAGRIRLSSQSLEESTLGGLLFVIMLLVAFHLIRPVGRRAATNLSRILDRPDTYSARDTIAARCLSVVSLSVYAIIAASPSGQGVFGSFGYPATLISSPVLPLGLLFWDMERRNNTTSRAVFWGAVTFIGIAGLGVGMLGSIVEPMIVAIVFLWTVRGRIPVGLVVLALGTLVTLNSAKHAYRALTWNQGREIGITERAENWVTALEKTYGTNADEGFERSVDSTASRLSSLVSVAHMFEWVPNRVPFAGPAAWLNLPLSYVPRVIWPNKPQHAEEFNNRYTTTFRLQTARMTRGATFTLPSIGDGYWRMGWFGVLLEGFMLGLLAGAYQGMAEPASRGLCILGAGFVITCGPESHVLGLLSMQPQYLIASFIVLWMAQGLPSLFAGARKTKLAFQKRSMNAWFG